MKAHRFINRLEESDFAEFQGNVTRISTTSIEADGPIAKVGDYCEIDVGVGRDTIIAEVVSLEARHIRLMPLRSTRAIRMGARVTPARSIDGVAYGDSFSGRAVDALGQAIDGAGTISPSGFASRDGNIPKTLDRAASSKRVSTGVRVIDGLFPIGEGQRIGIFSASGVGKTSLVEQLSRQIECDHIVLCLIGERGREVEKLWNSHLRGEQKRRYTIVAATSDESASMRVRAVDQALSIAEHWRAQGKHVVLFVDSITRLALAQRELGLAAGEPPTVRAFTPNVFTAMPRIVERCGSERSSGGSITAIFTVLSETDDVDDPVVELMKSLLDGHIVLSRRLAEKGHFPAIDVSASVSRMANVLFRADEAAHAREAHRIFAEYDEARPMIESGIYRQGSNQQIDQAIAHYPKLIGFLQQRMDEFSSIDTTRSALTRVLPEGVA